MENDDIEKILTVKEIDRCCSFYLGIYQNMKKTIVSNFLIKFLIPGGNTLEIIAVDPFKNDSAPQSTVVELQAAAADIEVAVLFLMQQNYKFSIENSTLKTRDPAGNDLCIVINGEYDPDFINSDQRTEKVQLS